jgi:hypothetical protein
MREHHNAKLTGHGYVAFARGDLNNARAALGTSDAPVELVHVDTEEDARPAGAPRVEPLGDGLRS